MRSSLARLGAATLVLALGFFAGLHLPLPVHAVDHTVTTTADSGPGSLRQALTDANVSPGPDTITFAVTGTIALDSPLPAIGDDLTLQGPGAGELAISGGYLYRIFDISPTVAVTVTDLALIEGRAPNGEAGGAIRSRGQLQLLRVDLHDNLSADSGGALAVEGGALRLEDSLVQSNTASSNGGIYIGQGTTTIIGSTITHNRGSGIEVYHASSVHIIGTLIGGNDGHGLDSEWGDLYITNTQVMDNGGGGIKAFAGLLVVSDSVVARNRADSGAGVDVWSTAYITNTVLTENQAASDGGAINVSIWNGRLTLTSSVVTANTARFGAGIYSTGGDLQVQSTLIAGNQGRYGPAVYLFSANDALLVDSCIMGNQVTSDEGFAVELGSFNSYYLAAPRNWWGATDGPDGAGPGSGDSVDDQVIFANFRTAPPEYCRLPDRLYLPGLAR